MSHPQLTALAMAVLLTFAGAEQAIAAAPMAKTAAPGYYRMMLGDFEITALSDGTVDLPAEQLLSETPANTRAALAAAFLTSPVETSVNAYLINTGSKLILIDTGAAALFGPTLGKLQANLKAAGYDAAQVDEIYLTHVHPDHAGGLQDNGAAAFPNAVVRADQREADFWLSQARMDAAPAASKGFFQGAMASMKAYVAAGRFRPFAGETVLQPGIRAVSSYGHSAGHVSYEISSKGKTMLVVGDLIHVPAVQLAKPGVTIAFDSDAKTASAARATAFANAARDGVLVAASHMQFPGLGHLKLQGKKYRWIPANHLRLR